MGGNASTICWGGVYALFSPLYNSNRTYAKMKCLQDNHTWCHQQSQTYTALATSAKPGRALKVCA